MVRRIVAVSLPVLVLAVGLAAKPEQIPIPTLEEALKKEGFLPTGPAAADVQPGDVFDLGTRERILKAAQCLRDPSAQPDASEPFSLSLGSSAAGNFEVRPEFLPKNLGLDAGAYVAYIAEYTGLQRTAFDLAALRSSSACEEQLRQLVSKQDLKPVWIQAVLRGSISISQGKRANGQLEALNLAALGAAAAQYKDYVANSLVGVKTAPIEGFSSIVPVRPSPAPDSEHLLLDLDLGVPAGVRVGYDFGNNSGHGIGMRAGVGPAWFSSSLLVGVLIGAFGEIGLGGEGRWRIEPTAGIGIVSSSVGFLGGLDVHYQTPRRAGSSVAEPAVGFRAGADVGVVSSSVVVMPDASLVLSW